MRLVRTVANELDRIDGVRSATTQPHRPDFGCRSVDGRCQFPFNFDDYAILIGSSLTVD